VSFVKHAEKKRLPTSLTTYASPQTAPSHRKARKMKAQHLIGRLFRQNNQELRIPIAINKRQLKYKLIIITVIITIIIIMIRMTMLSS